MKWYAFLFRVYGLGVLILLVVSCTMIGTSHPSLTNSPPAPSTTSSPTFLATIPFLMNTALPSPTISPTRTERPSLTITPVRTPTQWLLPWVTLTGWIRTNQVRTLVIDRIGNLWAGGPGGLVYWDIQTGISTPYVTKTTSEHNQVDALILTPDGVLWAGTFGFGLSRFDGANWRTYTTQDGLPSNYITSLVVTPDGELWVDTIQDRYSIEGEFGRFDGKRWISATSGGYFDVIAAPDGSLWGVRNGITLSSSIYRFDGVKWELKKQFQMYDLVTAMTVAPNGEVWVATQKKLFLLRNDAWREIKPPWDETVPDATAIATTQDGAVWFGFSYAPPLSSRDKCGYRSQYKEIGVYRYDGKSWTHFTDQDGLVDNKICAITVGPDGSVWFGSYDKGVSRYDGHTWTNYIIP